MKRRFRGESVNKVDGKGRVSVPATFRRVLEEGDPDWATGLNPTFVLLYGGKNGRCLEGYTVEGVSKIDEQISSLPPYSKARTVLERWINTQSTYAQVDENGRMVLSQRLRDLIGVGEEALFAGMGERFQVWNPADYAADMAALDDWSAALPDGEDPFALLGALGRLSGGGS